MPVDRENTPKNVTPQWQSVGDLAAALVRDNHQVWTVGDRVKTNLDHAWVYAGTERESLMSLERNGTVVQVPLETQAQGYGTVLVRWESLTSKPLKRSEFWTHTDLIVRAS